tara:strand:+ start:357 stop:980 length:624 start_codon:yes stop_codon:yes gene_type:complete
MNNPKSLVNGIGNVNETKKYYNDWSENYDFTLSKWNYTVPKKSINLLKKEIKYKPKKILDLACGTGLFGEELIKIYTKSQIYGSDISQKSLILAKKKNIYKNLIQINFENKKKYNFKFDLVSMIGAMTYCKNFDKLFININYYLYKKGYFLFSHRTDLWKKQEFDKILKKINLKLKIISISRPYNYLPLNTNFKNKIKIRLVLLQKN